MKSGMKPNVFNLDVVKIRRRKSSCEKSSVPLRGTLEHISNIMSNVDVLSSRKPGKSF